MTHAMTPYYEDAMYFTGRRPVPRRVFHAILLPFSSAVWGYTMLSLALVAAALACIRLAEGQVCTHLRGLPQRRYTKFLFECVLSQVSDAPAKWTLSRTITDALAILVAESVLEEMPRFTLGSFRSVKYVSHPITLAHACVYFGSHIMTDYIMYYFKYSIFYFFSLSLCMET